MWTITLRLEIMDSSNRPVKVINCERWTGGKNDPFYVAHAGAEQFHLNRNNILSIVKKHEGNSNN